MDELPAIIHKLSHQLWCHDQLPRDDTEATKEGDEEVAVDALATLPADAVDANGNVLDANEISSISLEGGSELHSLFSQGNLKRLTDLNNLHRTLSLFTPGIPNAVFRAWAGPNERHDTGRSTPMGPGSLLRTQSAPGRSTTYSFTDSPSLDNGSLPSRPSLVSLHSATTGLALGAGRHPRMSRKKKTRVVNLRSRSGTSSAASSEMGDTTTSETNSVCGPTSEPLMSASIPEEPEEATAQVPTASSSKVRFQSGTAKDMPPRTPLDMEIYNDPTTPKQTTEKKESRPAAILRAKTECDNISILQKLPITLDRTQSDASDTSSEILEQAWINKMAGEIARRVYDEKQRNAKFWAERDDAPPPAYEATQ
jgi:mitochondrial distribution and morphology protein 34